MCCAISAVKCNPMFRLREGFFGVQHVTVITGTATYGGSSALFCLADRDKEFAVAATRLTLPASLDTFAMETETRFACGCDALR
eukprot:6213305-Pleurochrysis_carterae.AAC.3